MSTVRLPSDRIVSLDQFRGYTVAGMFLVNFLGGYAACPRILKHTHDYCSYADTIMPQFLFAVGFAFRLTFERRVEREGLTSAYARVIRRLLGLALVALVVYVHSPIARNWEELQQAFSSFEPIATILKRTWFQTLMHIAVTSLWILPVIRSSWGVRIMYALVSAIAHIGLSWWFNYEWCNTSPAGIDGGPLGFLTWTVPAICGTLACDLVVGSGGNHERRSPVLKLIMAGLLLMGIGWGLSCGTRFYDQPQTASAASTEGGEQVVAQTASRHPGLNPKVAESPVLPKNVSLEGREWKDFLAEPPFVPPPESRAWNYWMMTQRGGSLSYTTFAAGFAFVVFAVFYVLCDRWGLKVGIFQTLGANALAGYVLHDIIDGCVSTFTVRDCPAWYMWSAFGVFFFICWLFLRTFEKNGIFFRL